MALYYYGSGSSSAYKRIKYQVSSGTLVLNDSLLQFANCELPFGGVGTSGMGSVHGEFGFKECVHYKPVMEKGTYNGFPFFARFP